MASETVEKIPLVDLSKEDLKPGSGSWLSACNDLRQTLERYGCLQLVYSKFSLECHNRTFSAMEDLFQLPQEVKMKNVNPKPGRGYLGKEPNFPIYEGLGIEYPTNRDECLNFTNLMWPQGNDHFCDAVHSFATTMAELHELLVRMLFESYGIEKQYESSHISSPTYLLRMIKYERSHADTNLGLQEHTDPSFLSLLHHNHGKGLEIKTKDGDWVTYEPISSTSSFVLIAGEVFMAWSNDRIKTPHHRVIVSSEQVRYTIGFFSFLTGMVEAPEELVDDEHPPKYKPFEHQGLLDFLELGFIPNDKYERYMVKAYCGV